MRSGRCIERTPGGPPAGIPLVSKTCEKCPIFCARFCCPSGVRWIQPPKLGLLLHYQGGWCAFLCCCLQHFCTVQEPSLLSPHSRCRKERKSRWELPEAHSLSAYPHTELNDLIWKLHVHPPMAQSGWAYGDLMVKWSRIEAPYHGNMAHF